jgi:hypothetical protein
MDRVKRAQSTTVRSREREGELELNYF